MTRGASVRLTPRRRPARPSSIVNGGAHHEQDQCHRPRARLRRGRYLLAALRRPRLVRQPGGPGPELPQGHPAPGVQPAPLDLEGTPALRRLRRVRRRPRPGPVEPGAAPPVQGGLRRRRLRGQGGQGQGRRPPARPPPGAGRPGQARTGGAGGVGPGRPAREGRSGPPPADAVLRPQPGHLRGRAVAPAALLGPPGHRGGPRAGPHRPHRHHLGRPAPGLGGTLPDRADGAPAAGGGSCGAGRSPGARGERRRRARAPARRRVPGHGGRLGPRGGPGGHGPALLRPCRPGLGPGQRELVGPGGPSGGRSSKGAPRIATRTSSHDGSHDGSRRCRPSIPIR